MFKLLWFVKSICRHEQFRVVRFQGLTNLCLRPNIGFSLNRIRLSIQRGTETAARQRHFTLKEYHQFGDHLAIERIVCQQRGLRIDLEQLRLIVKHFLEVRHIPTTISTVAMKTATEMITDAAFRHRRERMINNLQEFRTRIFSVHSQQ